MLKGEKVPINFCLINVAQHFHRTFLSATGVHEASLFLPIVQRASLVPESRNLEAIIIGCKKLKRLAGSWLVTNSADTSSDAEITAGSHYGHAPNTISRCNLSVCIDVI